MFASNKLLITKASFIFFLCAWFFFFTQAATAQITLPGDQTILTLSPDTPQAGQRFVATIEAYSYDLNRATISWLINDVVQQELTGERSISLTAPALGESLKLTAQVTEQGGTTHTVSQRITPSAVDIIIESLTQVPSFYHGRPLPSAGSTVRFIAFPSLYMANGQVANPRQIVYTWKIDSRVVRSGIGNNTFSTVMPQNDTLTVELISETSNGEARHTSYAQIAPINPQIIFYEDNPLYGISRNALPNTFTLLNEEITVRAEPYFMSSDVFSNAQYSWNIDSTPAQSLDTDPRSITLRGSGGAGFSAIEFSVRNLKSLLQAASGTFTMYFGT